MIPISERKRIVVKVGTSTLTHRTGRLNIRRVEQLVKTLADLQNAGHEVILVSSGAIGLGMGKLGLMDRPKDTPGKQACAAVGQCELMYLYDNLFSEYSITVAQLLLTKYILLEDRRKNVENALERLISQGVIPVVNENETVSIASISARQNISESYLEQLVRPLRKAGFIESVRGAGGGYVLAKPADSISVGDVLRVLEGGLEAVTCSVNEGLGGCDAADFCVTRFVWQRINEGITNAVDSISLGELVQQSRQLEKNRNSDRNDKE